MSYGLLLKNGGLILTIAVLRYHVFFKKNSPGVKPMDIVFTRVTTLCLAEHM